MKNEGNEYKHTHTHTHTKLAMSWETSLWETVDETGGS